MKRTTPGSQKKKIDLNWSTLHLPANKRMFQFIDKGFFKMIENKQKLMSFFIIFHP